MAFTPGRHLSAMAGGDLHASSHCIVKWDVNGNAVLASAATDKIVGVLDEVQQASPQPQSTSGGAVSIVGVSADGTFEVVAGSSINAGDYLTSDSNGHAVTATQTTAGSQPTVRVFGRARYAANSGDLVEYECMNILY